MLSSGDKAGAEQGSSSRYSLEDTIAHIKAVRYCCDNFSTGERKCRELRQENSFPHFARLTIRRFYLGVLQEALPSVTTLPRRALSSAVQETATCHVYNSNQPNKYRDLRAGSVWMTRARGHRSMIPLHFHQTSIGTALSQLFKLFIVPRLCYVQFHRPREG